MAKPNPLPTDIDSPRFKRRFWMRVSIDRLGCWIWGGYIYANGYGKVSISTRGLAAHRVAYAICNGRDPFPLQVDHLCRKRSCVNPDHLEAVDNRTNVLRGIGVTAQNAKKTHCIRGHEYTEANTYRYRSRPGRECLECMRARKEKTRLANRGKG